MKKLLIVISSFSMGGFSKSLINFLLCMNQYHPEYKITILVLSNEVSTLETQIPSEVNIIHINLKYENLDKKSLTLKMYKAKYILVEMICKYVKHKDIPVHIVREFAQAKLSHQAKCIINDFGGFREFETVISWSEGFCNYVIVGGFLNRHKIGYIHPNYREAGFSKAIDKKYIGFLDRIVTVSESCCDTLISVFPEYKNKIVYIPNCLNLDYYKKLATSYIPDYDKNTINLLTVARIVDYSRAVFRIVNIVDRLRNDGIQFKWYLIGDGQDYLELQKKIKENDLQNYIICLGSMDNPCPYIKQADLYIQQSYYEGRPVSVDEAMILGTPALITNYSSAKEQVKDNLNGWIVENDEECIYIKLRELLMNPKIIEKAHEFLDKENKGVFENCDTMISMIESLK